ncbi:lactate dehydrogenase-like 2-hydroxyacid dehydrogenase [Chitinophaga skermanii]|uniref:Glyoxylate/hydroxypyruvate reductase B n=1 Tax=Chitinophaga skermanii TaxID=331697 RepID=A0A327R2M8_9BACT|nr:D-glycerate dehydrogenase [Chitinophaga skermanii]RAJ10881.1 lactate dehydrogenase-like 2-hydroxyacid dehydrogenase [Chitinophaga skermanii]
MKIFITREIPQVGLDLLTAAGHTYTQYTEKAPLSPAALVEGCLQHDALLSVGPNKLNTSFFSQVPNIKAVALLSVGYDNLDVHAATEHRIPVSNTPGVLSKATSDVAFLLMLAVSRKAFFMHQSIKNGQWGFFEPKANLGIELYGKTLGVFGLGKIGLELAKKCKAAYDMHIIYHNRSRNEEAEALLGARYVSFDELLSTSDVVSVHANLSPSTQNIFNAAAFAKMKPSAIFVNTARGGLHNEKDLMEALQQEKIWGAGLDVTNPEPMTANNPLLDLPNVCILPHIGSATKETRDAMATLAAQNLIAALKGEKMPNVINHDVYQ